MKKVFLSFLSMFVYFATIAQSVEIKPSVNNYLKIGPGGMPTTNSSVHDLLIRNKTTYDQSRILLIDNDGDTPGDSVLGAIDARLSPTSSSSALQIGTVSNHPIKFFNYSTFTLLGGFSKGGDFSVRVDPGTTDILSRTHSYGVGENAVNYSTFYPFKSAMLGQAFGTVTANTNRVGVLGMTDGAATSGSYNIGVAGIGSNTNTLTSGSSVFGLYGHTAVTTSGGAYGGYHYSNNAGTGTTYGNYNYAYKPSSSGTAYGSINYGYNDGSGLAYGAYNYGSAQNNDSYGSYNSASTSSTVNGNYAYGSYNTAYSGGNSQAYGSWNTASNLNTTTAGSYGDTYGTYTEANNNATEYYAFGLYGKAGGTSTGLKFGVYGWASSNTGTKFGVYGYASGTGTNYAGYFAGNVHINGSLSKASGTFKIDHPLDPENKYLYHSFVESPDMMNIYNGNITTDANGEAKVTLPSYFDALNKDFRYQLTTIGKKADAWISEEIVGNSFKISTDQPNTKVSWQVTGVREDAFANANRVVAEVDKKAEEKGKYLHPEAFGKAESMGIDFANNKAPSPSKVAKEQAQPEVLQPQVSTPWPIQMPKPAKEGSTDGQEPKKE